MHSTAPPATPTHRHQVVSFFQRQVLARWFCVALLTSGLGLGVLADARSNPTAEATRQQAFDHTADLDKPSERIDPPPRYWQDQREGWFWYRDPPDRPTTRARPSHQAKTAQPSELQAFEAMQRRLEELKRIAVMNPTDAHLLAYMRYQRMVMDKSQTFAERWQRLLWQAPELDYALQGRPTNAMAIQVFDEQQRQEDARTVQALARQHALLFLFRGDCPFCHRFAPILKRFGQAHGITIFAVSLDGGALPDFPDARPDNGIAARLATRSVPALFLSQPGRREIRPVGYGLMSDTELLQRVAAVGREVLGPISGQTSGQTPGETPSLHPTLASYTP